MSATNQAIESKATIYVHAECTCGAVFQSRWPLEHDFDHWVRLWHNGIGHEVSWLYEPRRVFEWRDGPSEGRIYVGYEEDAEFIAHARTDIPALVGELRAERSRTETALSRLTLERDASRAFAKEGETYQHDLAAARGWAFGLAVSLLDGSEPA